MTLQQWQQQGRWFHQGGYRRFYLDQGQGPVLLLIHGFPSASWDWHPLLPQLSRDYRVIAMDMLGFGLSDKPHPHRYRIVDQARDWQALLQQLSIDKAHILAHDYGDSVAQELLAIDPDRWLSCCFLNGGLFADAHRPLKIQTLLASPLGPLLIRFLGRRRFDASLNRIWGDQKPTTTELDTLWQLLLFNQGRRVMPSILDYMAQRRQHQQRWTQALVDTQVPLKLIDGTQDPISGHTLVQRYRQLIADADISELDRVGHYPQLEAPERVLSHWRDFINRSQKQTGPAAG
ncbi:alpha/beta fold hydrolase [Ferrimonas sp. SCSIO 43195]|uniref:alpha/beta fold hydrolase n=1 Tax=Ferrimonas sp. SCSIO 43195 TaxID=2822844 RepID=UPI002075B126|nr:alpha/beta hydrolase [Ferrimonas sp. SCSIO 43195]USD37815.1 alpha/beta hydrolase [Ferrimonas sp. SCSIO 43195]